MTCIEGKVEFRGEVRGIWKHQAGAVIAEIADNTTDHGAAVQDELGTLEYFGPLEASTLKHSRSLNLQFNENSRIPNLLHIRKWVRL
jgi:hypothetical protein